MIFLSHHWFPHALTKCFLRHASSVHECQGVNLLLVSSSHVSTSVKFRPWSLLPRELQAEIFRLACTGYATPPKDATRPQTPVSHTNPWSSQSFHELSQTSDFSDASDDEESPPPLPVPKPPLNSHSLVAVTRFALLSRATRDLVWSSPQLWTRLRFTTNEMKDTGGQKPFLVWLQRSGTRPIFLDLDMTSEGEPEVWEEDHWSHCLHSLLHLIDVLTTSSKRWHSLRVRLDVPEHVMNQVLSRMKWKTYPNARILSFDFPISGELGSVDEALMVFLIPLLSHFPSLTKLALPLVPRSRPGAGVSAGALRLLLDHLPHLEHLQIADWGSLEAGGVSTSTKTILSVLTTHPCTFSELTLTLGEPHMDFNTSYFHFLLTKLIETREETLKSVHIQLAASARLMPLHALLQSKKTKSRFTSLQLTWEWFQQPSTHETWRIDVDDRKVDLDAILPLIERGYDPEHEQEQRKKRCKQFQDSQEPCIEDVGLDRRVRRREAFRKRGEEI
ncbi:hypothetical protein DL96DRAFT_148066 [Flagelloscypha sp. PMI_526]|nr:hypothetical protein DL96DRAFT_148066 [Flagelloscypha sp. PMI_526]